MINYLWCLLLPLQIVLPVIFQSYFQQISMDFKSRSLVKGYTTIIDGEIFYTNDGRMLTFIESKEPLVIVSTKEGQLSVYNQAKNQVIQKYGSILSNEQSEIAYFLKPGMNDLGLSNAGFSMIAFEPEEHLLRVEFQPPVQLAGSLEKIVMIYEDQQPIYVEYQQPSGDILKKVYFGDFINYSGVNIPTKVTKIDFLTGGDSTLTRTEYKNVRVNKEVDKEKLNFAIPANAKLIKE